jgi:hypothetical protein
MYIKQEMYNGKMTDILYPNEGFLLEHKITKLVYGSVSLEDGRKQEDYDEIKEQKDDNSEN